MPFLYCIDPDGSARSRCRVSHRPVVIGRSKSADLTVPDDHALSHEHFVLFRQSRGICIRDLGSTNGTWINGRRITEQMLTLHDRIAAGQSLFALEPGLVTMLNELT